MKILFIGDISGEDGKKAIKENLEKVKRDYNIDYVIANAENTSAGRGLTLNDFNELKDYGINFFTMGNHTWFHPDFPIVLTQENIIRPKNISEGEEVYNIGYGYKIIKIKDVNVCISNLIGSSVDFKYKQTNPFIEMEKIINENKDMIHIVDFHAETTSEKNAFFLCFKGKVSLIIGTHTHVQTADEKIFEGTAYITDVGMTGNCTGVIGAKPNTIIEMFQDKRKYFKLETNNGRYQFNAVFVEIDEQTKRALLIKRICIYENK